MQLSQHMPRMPQKNNRLRTDKGETQKTKHDEDGDGNGDGEGDGEPRRAFVECVIFAVCCVTPVWLSPFVTQFENN